MNWYILLVLAILIISAVVLYVVLSRNNESVIKEGSEFPSNKMIKITNNNSSDLENVILYDSQGNSYLPDYFFWPSKSSFTILVSELDDGDSLQLIHPILLYPFLLQQLPSMNLITNLKMKLLRIETTSYPISRLFQITLPLTMMVNCLSIMCI